MNKRAISVTLAPNNLLWIRAKAASSGCRSVSEMLDRLIYEARTSDRRQDESMRSVVGTIRIAESDPDLSTADAAVRALFATVLSQPSASARSRHPTKRAERRAASKGARRG